MDEFIHFFDNILEEDNNSEEKTNEESSIPDYCLIYNNNNDAFNFLLTTFLYFKLFIFYFYDFLISSLSTVKHFCYKIQYILLLTIFLFTFVKTFEENKNITTDLIISAYFQNFPQRNLTWIIQEMLEEKEKKNTNKSLIYNNSNNLINININNYEYKISWNNNSYIYGNRKDLICNGNIMNEKECNYSKSNKIYKDIINNNENDIDIDNFKEFEENIKKTINNKDKNKSHYQNEDKNLFYLIHIKSLLINSICFILLYFIIKTTIKSKIRGSLLLNLLCLYILYNIINNLYKDKYYLASSFIFILLIYTNKNLIDSIYLKLKFRRKDFEIFTPNLIAFNSKQFALKIIHLLYAVIISSILSILFFKFWLNYLVNYLCLLALISFSGNCIEQIASYNVRPIKNILMFFVGMINLISSKIILKYYLFEEKDYHCFINNKAEKNNCKQGTKNNHIFSYDSLYLINDLFSLYCLDYINGFLENQIRLFLSGNKNYIKINYMFYFFFFFIIIVGYFGLFTQEFICFFISLYMARIMINNFCKKYHFKIVRIINNLIMLIFIIFIQRMDQIKDYYLVNLLMPITHLNETILSFSFKFIFLLCFIYYIITTNFILYVDYNYNSISKKSEGNGNNNSNYFNNSKIYDLIYIISEIILQYLIICLIIIIYNYYETKFIMKVLYLFIIIIFHSLKIQIINENKEKNNEKQNIINYNLSIFIWIIISLRLIHLCGTQISLIYIINHLNLILIINFYILNEKKNNNIFKITIILLLAIGYYILNSSIFIVDAIAIVISPIIKNCKNNNNDKICISKEQKLKNESLKVYNRLTFFFVFSILLFSLLQVGYTNIFGKYFKEFVENVYILYKEINERKIFNENEEFEFYIISKFIKI